MSKKMKIDSLSSIQPHKFLDIIGNSLSLDHIYCLELVEKDIDLADLFKDSLQGQALVQTLTRKGMISNGVITEEGKSFMAYIRSTEEGAKPKLKKRTSMSDDDFDRFWFSYPATDNVIKDGKILYKGTRAMRKGNKQEIRVKLSKILEEGKYSLDDIIKAIEFETQQKIDESIKKRENKLSFMQNIETYINQRTFEAYVEVAKLRPPGESSKPIVFVTDI